jgi:hypothetical protein
MSGGFRRKPHLDKKPMSWSWWLAAICVWLSGVRVSSAMYNVANVRLFFAAELCSSSNETNLDAVPILELNGSVSEAQVQSVPYFAMTRQLALLATLVPASEPILPPAETLDLKLSASQAMVSDSVTPLVLRRVGGGTALLFSSCGEQFWDFAEELESGRASVTHELWDSATNAMNVISAIVTTEIAVAAPFSVAPAVALNVSDRIDSLYFVTDLFQRSGSGCKLPAFGDTTRSVIVRTATGLFDCNTTAGNCIRLVLPVNFTSFTNVTDFLSPFIVHQVNLTEGDMIVGDIDGVGTKFTLAQPTDRSVLHSIRPVCQASPFDATLGPSFFNVSTNGLLAVVDAAQGDGAELVAPGAARVELPVANGTTEWTTLSTDRSKWPTFALVFYHAATRKRLLITKLGTSVMVGNKQLTVAGPTGAGSVTPVSNAMSPRGRGVVFDCNNDGLLDVLLLGDALGGSNATILVGVASKPEEFRLVSLPAPLLSAGVFDVNGDGMPDLLTTSMQKAMPAVFLNTGVRGAPLCAFRGVRRDPSTPSDDELVAAVSDVVGDSAPEWVGTNGSPTSAVRLIDARATSFVTVRLRNPRFQYALVRVTLPRAPKDKSLYAHVFLDPLNQRDDQATVPLPRSQRFDLELLVLPGGEPIRYCSVSWRNFGNSIRLFDLGFPVLWNDTLLRSPIHLMNDSAPSVSNMTLGATVRLADIISFDQSSFFANDRLSLSMVSTCFDESSPPVPAELMSAADIVAELARERIVVKQWSKDVRVCDLSVTLGYGDVERGCDAPRVFVRKFSVAGILPPTASAFVIGSETGGANGDAAPEVWHYAVGVIAGLLLLAAIGVIVWAVVTRGSASASAAKARLRGGAKASAAAADAGTAMSAVKPTSEYGQFPPEKAAYGDSQFSELA